MLSTLTRILKRRIKGNQRTIIGLLAGILGLASNFVLFAAKLAIGMFSGSVTIQADAVNNLSDTVSSILTLIGFKVAGKPADKEHPYGHERFESISGLLVSLVITYVGVSFLSASFKKILQPKSVKFSILVVIILLVSILIKIWQGGMYRKLGKQIHSEALLTTAKDSFNDVMITGVVILSAVIEYWTGWHVDGYFGLLLALYILYSGITALKSFIDELLGMRPDEHEIKQIQKILEQHSEIIGFHDLLIHNYGPHNIFASVHIEVDETWSLPKAHEVIDRIEHEALQQLGIDLVCHLDPFPLDDKDYKRIAPVLKRLAKMIDPDLRLHDLRIVHDTDTIQFDLVVPAGCVLKDAEIKRYLEDNLPKELKSWHLVITFDHNYLL